MKVPCGLSIESETLTRIDQIRGEVPRSRVLERLINRGIAAEKAEKVGNES